MHRTLSIPFTLLNEGRVSFHFDWHPGALAIPQVSSISDALNVDVEVTSLDGGYLMRVTLSGRVTLLCGRCGEEFVLDLCERADTFHTFDASQVDSGNEGEIRLIPSRDAEIDITPDAIDILVLAIPVKCLCSDDCKGLCVRCGTNLNAEQCTCRQEETDPRWDALKKLTSKSDE